MSDYNFAFSLFRHWVKDTTDKNLELKYKGDLFRVTRNLKQVCEGGRTDNELFQTQMQQLRLETSALSRAHSWMVPRFGRL